MAKLTDPGVAALIEPANYATVSTLNEDGSITSSVVWFDVEDGKVAVNGVEGRRWTENALRNGTVAIVVPDPANPGTYVEVRGTAVRTGDEPEADAHIDRLAKRYAGLDRYPAHSDAETRVKFLVDASVIRLRKG